MLQKNLGAFAIQSSMTDIFASLIELQESTREHCFAQLNRGTQIFFGRTMIGGMRSFRSAKGITSITSQDTG
jgi:hypothetical protein